MVEKVTVFTNRYMRKVNYMVHASNVANSLFEMENLLEKSPKGSTLTIWYWGGGGNIDYENLVKVIKFIGKDRVYLDMLDSNGYSMNNMIIGMLNK